ncbi:hypothetical protein SAMN05216249_11663 [Acetitomaculum ruminis DSM 5522]|uniref:PEGA domain-containing protein n=1 Tax=Acetitomaculum ruminis DSM 5522 TaxID=1120918 RepID=A0A1I0ZSP4_9FIRM|nr:hypothetical protein [Acetitomaculum ruminis]SFB27358.1 hypothetical protein SAMN05216249_11663 [Acetitomaculum ruminis DSM 5522]
MKKKLVKLVSLVLSIVMVTTMMPTRVLASKDSSLSESILKSKASSQVTPDEEEFVYSVEKDKDKEEKKVKDTKEEALKAQTATENSKEEKAKVKKANQTQASSKNQTKTLIAKLKGEPLNVSLSDKAKIESALKSYQSLSDTDKKELDEEVCHEALADGINTGQSYGRILESNEWALYSLETPDTSTTLKKGTYTANTKPALSSTSDKGKSTSARVRTWTIESVTVDKNHNATAKIMVNSTTYDYIQCAGKIFKPIVDTATGTCSFNIPIDLNSSFYILGHSSTMPTAIAYKITSKISEPVVKDTVDVTFTAKNSKKEVIKNLTVLVNGGKIKATKGVYTLMKNTSYKVEFSAKGYKSVSITYKALKSEEKCVTLTKAYELRVKVEDMDTGANIGKATITLVKNDSKEKVSPFAKGVYYLYDAVKYTLTVKAEGYTSKSKNIYLKSDKTLTIQLSKKKANRQETSKAVKNVIKMIENLPSNPTEADRESIIAAQKAFIALESDEEAKVTNKERLDAIYKKLGAKLVKDGAGDYTFKDQYVEGGRGAFQVESISTTSNGQSMFRIVNAVLHVSDSGNMTADITLSSTGYRYVYMGNASDAFKAEEAAGGFLHIASAKGVIKGSPVSYKDSEGSHAAYRFTIPVESLDHPILIAGNSYAHDSTLANLTSAERLRMQGDGTLSFSSIWFQRAIIFSSANLVKVTSENNQSTVEERTDGEDLDKGENTKTSGGSQTVGKYAFKWSGGTMGHVVISCSNVEVKDGKAYATITFARKASIGGSAKFSMVRSLGVTVNGNNTFTIPVNLNSNTPIEAYTTAMSQGHWVSYTLYVGVNDEKILAEVGQDADGKSIESTVGLNKDTLDEEAPQIVGFESKGEIEVTYSNKIKIFEYNDGYYLIEIDSSKDTQREDKTADDMDALLKEKEKSDEEIAEDYEEDNEAKENNEAVKDKYSNDSLNAAYKNGVVKYFVVPEGKEVPVGLEEDLVIISQPVENVYVSSQTALELIDALNLNDKVSSLGIKKEDVEIESFAKRMAKDYKKDDAISYFGSYDKWNLKSMIKEKTGLIIESGEILVKDEENISKDWELFNKLTDRAAQMGTAFLIDRSSDEENDLAKAEWLKLYGIIFGQEENWKKAYDNVVGKATNEEKEEAIKALKEDNNKEI